MRKNERKRDKQVGGRKGVREGRREGGRKEGRKEGGRKERQGGWVSMVHFVGLHGYLHCHENGNARYGFN